MGYSSLMSNKSAGVYKRWVDSTFNTPVVEVRQTLFDVIKARRKKSLAARLGAVK